MQEAARTGAEAIYELAGVTPCALLDDSAQSLAEVAHDARNMVTALELYCELLDEPGVLSAEFRHYGSELKLLASASRRLMDKLLALNGARPAGTEMPRQRVPGPEGPGRFGGGELLGTPIDDLAFELESNRNLLGALAGPGVAVGLTIAGGALPVGLTSEDLTRILVNLIKNAVEAMPDGGRIELSLRETEGEPGEGSRLLVTVEDNGTGIAPELLEAVFEPGYSTRSRLMPEERNWGGDHLGLGLSITRSIVEEAGGRIRAVSRAPSGACFQIELPVRAGRPPHAR